MLNYNHLPLVEIDRIVNKAKQYTQESTIAKSVEDDDKSITLDALLCIIMYYD